MNYLRLDLKVCEGCGALWLRKDAAEGLYCRSCARRLAEFPAPRGKRAGGRRPRLTRASRCAAHTQAQAGGAR